MPLTPEEQSVMRRLVQAWNEFVKLPVQHEWDRQEFMFAIHSAQKIIMARSIQREFQDSRTRVLDESGAYVEPDDHLTNFSNIDSARGDSSISLLRLPVKNP